MTGSVNQVTETVLSAGCSVKTVKENDYFWSICFKNYLKFRQLVPLNEVIVIKSLQNHYISPYMRIYHYIYRKQLDLNPFRVYFSGKLQYLCMASTFNDEYKGGHIDCAIKVK